ncbi:MAG: hypothetical protein PHT40_00085 [Patescibacteria group bacterium]|nr:hypothetical protein [Patescibacteria group bacterium]
MTIRYLFKKIIFEINISCYYRNKNKWLEQGKEGQFVAIKGGRRRGFFATAEEAHEKNKPPFFCKQILRREPVYHIRSPRLAR